ncbi:MAG TPA: gephyrin-like molybdotransferase Glp [Solirubrobacterales bacterium]|nr:gephyrin-like molybdotransferase Glp [Solirubrobacterales bacterium]
MTDGSIELDDARGAVIARAAPLEAEEVALGEALGRRLAEDVAADSPVQGFDNSAMDGFAVRAADIAAARPGAPVALELAGESRAGHPASVALAAGQAIAISTGAMLPAGADAVVRVEDSERRGEAVLVAAAVAPGLDVRRAGEDIAAGEAVLSRGARIGPAQLGALASIDRVRVRCHRRPRVAVLTSGDELRMPGEPLAAGEVRNSNSFSVPALATLAGAEVCSVAWTPDEPEATRVAVEAGLDADVTLVCGGVSVGEHDHVKDVLDRIGVERVFWRVALKPGGPTWFGTRGETLVFGLPGNPVSSMVTFILLARPALVALGGGRPDRQRTFATLASDYEKLPGRVHALRCRLELTEGGWRAHPAPRQGSHILTSMLGADCLALVPARSGYLRAGERVEIELLDGASMAS